MTILIIVIFILILVGAYIFHESIKKKKKQKNEIEIFEAEVNQCVELFAKLEKESLKLLAKTKTFESEITAKFDSIDDIEINFKSDGREQKYTLSNRHFAHQLDQELKLKVLLSKYALKNKKRRLELYNIFKNDN
jgi:hypothetical protein